MLYFIDNKHDNDELLWSSDVKYRGSKISENIRKKKFNNNSHEYASNKGRGEVKK